MTEHLHTAGPPLSIHTQAYLENLFENVPEAIALADTGGRVLRINREFTGMFGYTVEEAVGRSIDELLAPAGKRREAQNNTKRVNNGERITAETQRRCKDNSLIHVSLIASPIFYHSRLVAVYGIYRDITRRKIEEDLLHQSKDELEEQVRARTRDLHLAVERLQSEIEERCRMEATLRQANEKLQQVDQLKSDFLSIVSHEMRTPLTSILGFIKIGKRKHSDLMGELLPAASPKTLDMLTQMLTYFDIIEAESERLTSLINDLLDLNKLESGKMVWRRESVVCDELISRAAASLQTVLEQKNLRFRLEVEPDLPAIHGDGDRLQQVVLNLLSNAVKFSEQGVITCRARRRQNEILISVSDQGVGIPPADQEKIFDKFLQLPTSQRGKPAGTGLGLPICKQIVEHHGGRIWVESDPGAGSTFSFTVPIAQAE